MDEKDCTLFAADGFGGLVPRPTTVVGDILDEFRSGFLLFNQLNHAWVRLVDEDRFAEHLEQGVRRFAPYAILTPHASALVGMTDRQVDLLATVPSAETMELPDDAAFREMLARMKAGERPAAAQTTGGEA
ncbi:MAG TPA: hypothetical protein VJ787_06320 [Thermoleophilia bacterium]|nr:hypothetical protein [Thermoleophilia bacterium]